MKSLYVSAVFLITLFPVCGNAGLSDSVLVNIYESRKALIRIDAKGIDFSRNGDEILFGQFDSGGGGVILTESGLAVTNAHIVRSASRVTVQLYDGSTAAAKVIEKDSQNDIALIQIEGGGPFPKLILSDSDLSKLKDRVFTVGNSVYLANTISEGKISGLAQPKTQKDNAPKTAFLKIDFKVYGGDSGTPILNEKGQLLGITSSGYRDKSGTFAVASNVIRTIITRYSSRLNENLFP